MPVTLLLTVSSVMSALIAALSAVLSAFSSLRVALSDPQSPGKEYRFCDGLSRMER